MSAIDHEKLWPGVDGVAKAAEAEKPINVFAPLPILCVEGYEPLFLALKAAFEQSSAGKGKARHANGKPFSQQPIMEIGRMVGLGFHTGQVCKKAQEATSMAARGDDGAARAELLGVIVYAAAAWLLVGEKEVSK